MVGSAPPPIPPPVPPVPGGANSLPPIPAPIPHDVSPEKVLANWKQTVDKSSGAIYYYNRVTKSVSWTPPEGF
jgi:hypothetical protein